MSGSLPMAATSSVRELSQFLGDQEGIAAAPHVQHPVVVEVEAGLEAVVAAQDLHRQPCCHDLGDRGRNEGLVGVLSDPLFALGVHYEHEPRWSESRDLLLGAGDAPGRAAEAGRGRVGETTWRLQRGRGECNLRTYASDTQALSQSDRRISAYGNSATLRERSGRLVCSRKRKSDSAG